MLTRLTDRIEKDEEGNDVKILRYGYCGTNREIEKHGKSDYRIYQKNGKFEKFTLLEEAEIRLKELARG